jgi:hypothetical protein
MDLLVAAAVFVAVWVWLRIARRREKRKGLHDRGSGE